MSIKKENTKDGIKLRDKETGKLAGSVSTSGKNAPTAQSKTEYARELEKDFNKIEDEWIGGDTTEAIESGIRYDRAREQLDEALYAALPEAIATLELGDEVNVTFLMSGNPEWDGVRVEAKANKCDVDDKLLEKLRAGKFTQETDGLLLEYKILKIEKSTGEDED